MLHGWNASLNMKRQYTNTFYFVQPTRSHVLLKEKAFVSTHTFKTKYILKVLEVLKTVTR